MRRLTELASLGGGLLILACAFLVSADILMRFVFVVSPLYSFEISKYAFAIAVSISFAYALITNQHIRIDFIYKLFPHRIRLLLDILNIASLTALSGFFVYLGYGVLVTSLSFGARSSTSLSLPLALPQSAWLVGLVVFLITALWMLFRVVFDLADDWDRPEAISDGEGLDP